MLRRRSLLVGAGGSLVLALVLTSLALAQNEFSPAQCVSNQNCSNCLWAIYACPGSSGSGYCCAVVWKTTTGGVSFKVCVLGSGVMSCLTLMQTPPQPTCSSMNYITCAPMDNQGGCSGVGSGFCQCSGMPEGTATYTQTATCV